MTASSENRTRNGLVAGANPMAGQLRRKIGGIRNGGAKARVRTIPIVMRNPLLEDASEVSLF